ncbi:MAG TPA: DNA repair protein RecO [Dehalococcoidia bacterium]|nr:DNA repair protein RecO [Dehalococcoidia bacterium]
MSAPRSYRTEAIVLRRTEFGEADRIVTFYTPEYGKLKAIAKGVRKPRSKLSGLVELFTHSTLLLSHGHNLDIVSQGEAIHPFVPLKNDLNRSGCAFYVVELVSRFTVEHQENAPVFDLLLATLVELCQTSNMDMLLRCFEADLLQCLGYRPNLHRCITCNSLLRPVANSFSPSGGGIICPACAGTEPVARPISANAIKVLRLLQNNDYAAICRVNMGKPLASEVEHVLRSYIEYLLERKVHSASWLDKLRHDARLSTALVTTVSPGPPGGEATTAAAVIPPGPATRHSP